jgi:ribosomal protein L9
MKDYQDLLTAYTGEITPPDEHSDGERNYNQYSQDNYTTPEAESQAVFAEFIPLDNSDPLPAFPMGAFSRICPASSEYIFAVTESVQASFDLVGVCTLGVLQIACMGRYPVRLPNGHIEQPCFYIAPIAPPSERKSGVITAVTSPLKGYQKEYNEKHGAEVELNQSELKILQGRIAAKEQAAIKAKTDEDREDIKNELQELSKELAEFEKVEELRLFGADITPEKLAYMLKTQGEVFALVSAEGGGIFENIGRYCEKGGLEIYLNGYSGDMVCVDRKLSGSVVIDHPTLNLILPCQPSVISDLFSDKQKAGRGLLSRILFVDCYTHVGKRQATSKRIDEAVNAKYNDLVRDMLSSISNGDLQFDDGGEAVYVSFFDEIEPQLTPEDGELSFMGDWAGKLPGQMVRLAGLIHCIAAFEKGRDPLHSRINADEAAAAVELARFFLAHAKAVYTEQREPQAITNAKYLWKRINSLNSLCFNKSELTRKVQNKGKFESSDYSEALKRLVDTGYIRIETKITGRARPTETIHVNPEAIK